MYGIEVKDKIAELYENGMTVMQIEKTTGVSHHTIYRVIKERGLWRTLDNSNLVTFQQIQDKLPIGRGTLWRVLNSIERPVDRRGCGGTFGYAQGIVQRIRKSDEYKRAISHRNHKKYLRSHPDAYFQDKQIMKCETCRFLEPGYDPAHSDYNCTNFRGGRKIKDLPNRTFGCWMWEWKEEKNDTERST